MKIGYPCINTSIVREGPSTFRLASYNEDCLVKVVRNNLDHLEKILHYNVKNNLFFFESLQASYHLHLTLYAKSIGRSILNIDLID